MSRETTPQLVRRIRRNYASRKSRLLSGDPSDPYTVAALRGEDSFGHPDNSLPGWLEVAESRIAGKGVFASRRFVADQAVLMGYGTILPMAESDARYSFSMRGADCPQLAFDCSFDSTTNMIKYFNSAHRTPYAFNAEVLWKGVVPFVVMLDDVEVGHEILLTYRVS